MREYAWPSFCPFSACSARGQRKRRTRRPGMCADSTTVVFDTVQRGCNMTVRLSNEASLARHFEGRDTDSPFSLGTFLCSAFFLLFSHRSLPHGGVILRLCAKVPFRCYRERMIRAHISCTRTKRNGVLYTRQPVNTVMVSLARIDSHTRKRKTLLQKVGPFSYSDFVAYLFFLPVGLERWNFGSLQHRCHHHFHHKSPS